ncbi:MAG: transposase family protein, partial [Pseudonocardiaceae bacterium]
MHPAIAESCASAIDGVGSDSDVGDGVADAAVGGVELLGRFAGISDGRSDQGRDHPVAVVLTLCVAGALAGMGSFTAIAGWIADVSAELLARLFGALRSSCPPRTPTPTCPSKTTLWPVLTGVGAAAVDAVIGAWPAERAGLSSGVSAADPAGGADRALLAVAVDAKTVRGAVDPEDSGAR